MNLVRVVLNRRWAERVSYSPFRLSSRNKDDIWIDTLLPENECRELKVSMLNSVIGEKQNPYIVPCLMRNQAQYLFVKKRGHRKEGIQI